VISKKQDVKEDWKIDMLHREEGGVTWACWKGDWLSYMLLWPSGTLMNTSIAVTTNFYC